MVAGTVEGLTGPAPALLLTLPHDSLSGTLVDIAPRLVLFTPQSIAAGAQKNEQRYIRGNPAGRGGQHP